MNIETIAAFLDGLPSYAEVEITWSGDRKVHLMARDRPRRGRRFTSLTNGTELFNIDQALAAWGATSFRFVNAFDVEVSDE
jgi:hypothetical protein